MQWILLMVHIPLVLSFILIVAGGIDPDSRDGPTFAATEATKAGVSLYLACFVVLIWATTVISARLYLADSEEVKILTTVVLSLPFFVVDVVYMMCFAFEQWSPNDFDGWEHMRFNVISGTVTIQLCMYVLPSISWDFAFKHLNLAISISLSGPGILTLILQASRHGIHYCRAVFGPRPRVAQQSRKSTAADGGKNRPSEDPRCGSVARDGALETARCGVKNRGRHDHAGSTNCPLDAREITTLMTSLDTPMSRTFFNRTQLRRFPNVGVRWAC
jgi:hypothetical protein